MLRCAITDRAYSPDDARHWAEQGMDFIQLREKTLDAGELAKLARAILKDLAEIYEAAVAGASPQLLINGRVDIAAVVGAAGVHLTAHPDELIPEQVVRIFAIADRPAPFISISCHMLTEVERSRKADVDLILFGPVFEKRVEGEQVSSGVGLDALDKACAAAGEIPVLALGGVTKENTAACLAAGAKGIAGIRLFA